MLMLLPEIYFMQIYKNVLHFETNVFLYFYFLICDSFIINAIFCFTNIKNSVMNITMLKFLEFTTNG